MTLEVLVIGAVRVLGSLPRGGDWLGGRGGP